MSPRSNGFTLVELIMVMVLVGIMSVVALPRMLDKTFSERGLRDGVKAAIQHARHVAIGARRYTCVTITQGTGTAGVVSVKMDTTVPESLSTVNCTTAVALASSGSSCAANQVCAPSGVSISAGSTALIIFDPQGRIVTASKGTGSDATVNISNQSALTVYAETGFVQ